MTSKGVHFVSFGQRHYAYALSVLGNGRVHVVCEAAGIDQVFLAEDIPQLLMDLPELIINEQQERQRYAMFSFRLPKEMKKRLVLKAKKEGYRSAALFVRKQLERMLY